jgi:acetyltransferase-like isoleucine patch superfamily enzyme
VTRARLRRLEGRARARAWSLLYRGVDVGPRAIVGRRCRLRVDRGSLIVIGEGAEIDDCTTLAAYGGGVLLLGARSFVGHTCTLAARERVELGEGTYLAELVSIRDHDHAVGLPPASGVVEISPVSIGARAWLGAKTTVLRGSSIGDDSVVGANAVVRGDVPAGVVAVGAPARVVRDLESVQ